MTNIKFRILSKDIDSHSVVVRYYSDKLSEDMLATSYKLDDTGISVIDRDDFGYPKRCQTDYNINIWNVEHTQLSSNSNVVIDYINNLAPFDWFDLKHNILDENLNTNMEGVDSIINKEFIAHRPIISNVTVQKDLSDEQIEALINSMVANLTSSSSTG